jgi:uncharacterized glyoxalase superfamily protein PhnB
MPETQSPAGTKSVTMYPTLRYRDALAAIDWLGETFGFERQLVVPGEDGRVAHAELRLGDGVVMLGSVSDGSDGRLAQPEGTTGVYVALDDVDALFVRARAAGAQMVREKQETDYGSTEFTARDLEGNLWSFGTYRP